MARPDDTPGPPLPPARALLFAPSTPRLTLTPLPPTGLRFDRLRRTRGRIPPDLETLIAVARAARKLTSDYEKAELLITVAKNYVRDDG